MYRPHYGTPRTAKITKPWQFAGTLKQWGHETAVHALAVINPLAYQYILKELTEKTPLERIMSGLWRDYSPTLAKMKQIGFGMLSPNSLFTFREKYFKKNDYPDPLQVQEGKRRQLEILERKFKFIKDYFDIVYPIYDRVGVPTKNTFKLLEQHRKCAVKILQIKFELGML